VVLRLNDNAEGYARGAADRISVSLRGFAHDGLTPPGVRLVVERCDREQRQEDQEAEDRRHGARASSPAETRAIPVNIVHYTAKTPRNSAIFPDDKADRLRAQWTESWQRDLRTVLYLKRDKTPREVKPSGLSGDEIDQAEARFDAAAAGLRL